MQSTEVDQLVRAMAKEIVKHGSTLKYLIEALDQWQVSPDVTKGQATYDRMLQWLSFEYALDLLRDDLAFLNYAAATCFKIENGHLYAPQHDRMLQVFEHVDVRKRTWRTRLSEAHPDVDFDDLDGFMCTALAIRDIEAERRLSTGGTH